MNRLRLGLFATLILIFTSPSFAVVTGTQFIQSFSCSGSTTAFSFTYPVHEASDIIVQVMTGGTPVVLTPISQYSVSLPVYQPGGTVTLASSSLCPSGSSLNIIRSTPLTQTTSYKNNQYFNQNTLMNDLDKIWMSNQETSGRAVHIPLGMQGPLTLPPPTPGGIIAWNQLGTAFENLLIAPPYVSTTVSASSYGSDISAAISAVGSSSVTLVVDSPITCNANAVVPANIYLEIKPPGIINISSGKTLAINGSYDFPLTQVFTGTGTITGLRYATPEWFGGGVGIDSGAAINAAIKAVNGNGPIYFQPGTYLSSIPILANIPRTHLIGSVTGNNYIDDSAGATIRFTGGTIGIDTYYTPTDEATFGTDPGMGEVYPADNVTIENLKINGNSTLAVGIRGGNKLHIKDSSVFGCSVAGARLRGVIETYIDNSTLNFNGSGLVFDSWGGTFYMTGGNVSSNTYGLNWNGRGGASKFQNVVFENNITANARITSINLVAMAFDSCYWETHDGDGGYTTPYYHLIINTSGISQNAPTFSGTNHFALTSTTGKVANVISGEPVFHDATLLRGGGVPAPAFNLHSSGTAILDHSFVDSPYTPGTKITQRVAVDKSTGLKIDNGGYISPTYAAFGTGDFTVSTVLEPNQLDTSNSKEFLAGPTHAFQFYLTGYNVGMQAVVIGDGVTLDGLNTLAFLEGSPQHIVYTRTSGVGTFYLNGRAIGTIVDTRNYSVADNAIGTSAPGLYMYQFSVWTRALTSQVISQLWQYGGNALAAGATTNLVYNLKFDLRRATQIYESVAPVWTNFNGAMGWLNPSTPSS